MEDKQELIYIEYMETYPHTLSAMYMDLDNDELMLPIIKKMKIALDTKTPLDSSIFELPEGALI